ncbi:MAG: hypothetical protein ACRDD4_02080 [Culicoidibacterales bacterium]
MASVTKISKIVKQPRGGYIKKKQFHTEYLPISVELHTDENITPGLVGITVDYLSRFMNGTKPYEAFAISLKGAKAMKMERNALNRLEKVKGLDDESIIAACQLSGYDVGFRAGGIGYRAVETIIPDQKTIENIRIMVERSQVFFKEYGPIIKEGFTFEGGYSEVVTSGDGDFITEDTLWDFKVSADHFKNPYTLQILMYYIMGKHSIHHELHNIKKIGFFNPRLNIVSILPIEEIDPAIITSIEKEIFQYRQ